eukprot:TRINITY_DN7927_c0_g1_i1.p2 TRINITY_DN7927_c0_g1~~TRINITY_DN7927_c0_g1_i1.p2  ORF type:complete len:117 (-),score=24.59 TRINITY_DN7927_c0_g1_i1:903-1253(-)
MGTSIGIGTVFLLCLAFPSGSSGELSGSCSWRLVMALPSALSALQIVLILFVFKHDSPHYYVLKGMDDQAMELLQIIYIDRNDAIAQYQKLIAVIRKIDLLKKSKGKAEVCAQIIV